MDSVLNTFPNIISKVTDPIGIAALSLLLVGTIALIFFGREKDWRVKMVVFVMLFGGLSLLLWAVLRPASMVLKKVENPECVGVDISLLNMAVQNAHWCGTSGATMTTSAQAAKFRTPSCISYAQRDFAGLSQNALHSEAKRLAKQGDDDRAFDLIDACQCHNANSQASVRGGRLNVICYLKKS